MNVEVRLASLFREISRLGIPCLVMGGHAVRYYGVDRSTFDYDFHLALAPADWENLPSTLSKSALFADKREGPSWRPKSFRRFIVGALPDGREERAEFWRENHLLAPFSELRSRAEAGVYGEIEVSFLGIDDLIRSKETERDDDWRDIRLLEEIADERRLLGAERTDDAVRALASLRSQRGLELAAATGRLKGATTAWHLATNPVTLALLAPYARTPSSASLPDSMSKIVNGPLLGVEAGSSRHHALVEAVRRLYMRQRMVEDRADKERDAGRPE